MNFKVRCISELPIKYFTSGKVYDVKNGELIDNTGSRYSGQKFESVSAINDYISGWGLPGRFELVEEETKYKVGDRVLIRSDLKVDKHYGGCRFSEWLAGLQGKVVKITRADAYPWGNRYDIDMGGFLSNEMIEKKVEEEKPFTKDDLKTGMFVTTRNRRSFRLLLGTENGDYGMDFLSARYIKLKCYNDDLTDKNNREWDIVKVESLKYPENMKRKLLWERKPEIHELTAKEAYKIIAEKKGVPVESLRVKWEG